MSSARVYGTSRSIELLRSGFFDAFIDGPEWSAISRGSIPASTAREIVRNSVLREKQYKRMKHHFFKPFVKRVQRECYLLAAMPSHAEQEALL